MSEQQGDHVLSYYEGAAEDLTAAAAEELVDYLARKKAGEKPGAIPPEKAQSYLVRSGFEDGHYMARIVYDIVAAVQKQYEDWSWVAGRHRQVAEEPRGTVIDFNRGKEKKSPVEPLKKL